MSRYLWVAALAVYLLLCVFFGERLPYNGGLGFDGYFYGTLAQNFPDVLAKGIPDYYLDRILPSLIVWLSVKALGISLTTAGQTVAAFHAYNSLLLTGAAVLWVRLSYRLEFSAEVAVIGAAALFVNWTVLKQYQYFVVQTDATALSAGALASLCVIERRYVSLAFVAAVTSFAFKAVIPFAVLLILFSGPALERTATPVTPWLPATAATGLVTIILYGIFWEHFSPQAGAAPVNVPALPLSIAVVAAYGYYATRNVPIERMLAACRLTRFAAIGTFVALWVARAAALALLAQLYANQIDVMDVKSFLLGSVVLSVAKPGVFLLAPVAVFGPAFLLFLWYLRRIVDTAARHSAGAALFLAAVLVLSLNPESRTMTFAYPLVVTFLCIALQDISPDWRFSIAFFVCSLLLSRCYLPLNALGMEAVGPGPLTDPGLLLRFPWQWVMMNIGPWMGWLGYTANAVMTGLAAVVLYRFRPPPAAVARSSL